MNGVVTKFIVVVAAKLDDLFLLFHVFLNFKNAIQFKIDGVEKITEKAVIVLEFAMSWGKEVPIGASFDSSFTSNFVLLDAELQLLEAFNIKRVDMGPSSVVSEVAGFFQGRKYISLDFADCFELRGRHRCCVIRGFELVKLFDL